MEKQRLLPQMTVSLYLGLDGAKAISDLHIHVPVWEGGTGHPLGVFREWIGRVGM
jgi:hypothetical protein